MLLLGLASLAVVAATPVFTTDRFGNPLGALATNAADTTHPQATGLALPLGDSSRTVLLWVQCAPVRGWFLSWGVYDYQSNNPLTTLFSENNNLNFWSDSGRLGVAQTAVICDSTWRHVALTYNGTHGSLYRDGQLVDQQIFNLATLASPLNLAYLPPFPDTMLTGQLDEVVIFDESFSSTRVAAFYASSKLYPYTTKAPVAFYPLDNSLASGIAGAPALGETPNN